MNSWIQFQKFLQVEKWKWLLVVSLLAITHIFCQSLMLPYGKALVSLLPDGETAIRENVHLLSRQPSSKIGDDPIIDKALNLINASLLVRGVKSADNSIMGEEAEDDDRPKPDDKRKGSNFILDSRDPDDGFDFVEDADLENDMPFEEPMVVNKGLLVENRNHSLDPVLEKRIETGNGISLKQVVKPNNQNVSDGVLKIGGSMAHDMGIGDTKTIMSPSDALPSTESSSNTTYLKSSTSSISTSGGSAHNISPSGRRKIVSPHNGNAKLLQLESANTSNDSALISTPVKKKMRCEMPPKTITSIDEMERLLVRHRARSRAMKPRWSSERDKEILAAKLQIENAPLIRNDRELYAPLFRNLSMFKRSYELMERILKVYVYKEGEKPIFHQPVLKGLYASEGWFMKLMEGNKRFTVKDPRRAHLFYMPFSSRMLEHALYVRNSHNRTNLRQYLKDYSEKIAAKYRFWNRTGGADHFLVACHDWAPYETRHHMEHCIKALCNADVTIGFKIGRDISLPETYVRAARNPLRDLGGKPPSQRHILAFYAGNMHGYLRPILLEYWKDRDPDMKLFGPMPPGVASKMNYIQHMKSSKYCICPKGYEVNSPRVVEAIFYQCVPVIISDNFVPPFFEVLNWNAFSIILAEKDIPNLKDILLSIPEERYLELQLGVRKVQQHFLWHAKPLKYDLFHMTLHSIWYNRVFQIKVR